MHALLKFVNMNHQPHCTLDFCFKIDANARYFKPLNKVDKIVLLALNTVSIKKIPSFASSFCTLCLLNLKSALCDVAKSNISIIQAFGFTVRVIVFLHSNSILWSIKVHQSTSSCNEPRPTVFCCFFLLEGCKQRAKCIFFSWKHQEFFLYNKLCEAASVWTLRPSAKLLCVTLLCVMLLLSTCFCRCLQRCLTSVSSATSGSRLEVNSTPPTPCLVMCVQFYSEDQTVIASSILHSCQNTAESCVAAWSRDTKIPQEKCRETAKNKPILTTWKEQMGCCCCLNGWDKQKHHWIWTHLEYRNISVVQCNEKNIFIEIKKSKVLCQRTLGEGFFSLQSRTQYTTVPVLCFLLSTVWSTLWATWWCS